jgi:hypothetical protein
MLIEYREEGFHMSRGHIFSGVHEFSDTHSIGVPFDFEALPPQVNIKTEMAASSRVRERVSCSFDLSILGVLQNCVDPVSGEIRQSLAAGIDLIVPDRILCAEVPKEKDVACECRETRAQRDRAAGSPHPRPHDRDSIR